MNQIPAIAFSAWSGVGKTTIIEQLVRNLKRRGIAVAVIKHDAHDFEIDKEGKDSWRFQQAGADITIIASQNKTAIIDQRSTDLKNIISRIRDVDLIIVEGYNTDKSIPHIGICRKESEKMFRLPIDEHVALVTNYSAMELEILEKKNIDIPIISLHDIEGLADYILEYFACV